MELNTLALGLSVNENVTPGVRNDLILDATLSLDQANMVKVEVKAEDIATELVDCVLHVNLYVEADESLANNNGPVQISYSINLGNTDYGVDEFTVEVTVSEKSTKKEKAKGRVKHSPSNQIGKPIPGNIPDSSLLG